MIKLGMRNKSAITVNIIRLYIITFVYVSIFLITGKYKGILSLSPEIILVTFISGLFGFVIGDYFYFSTLKLIGVSRTVPITSSYPLWTMLWAWMFFGREITTQTLLGALFIFLAIVIVRKGGLEERLDPKGFVYAILASISWSIAIVLLDFLSLYIDPFSLAGLRMTFAAIGISIFLPKYSEELREITKNEIWVLSGAALVGLIIGQYAFVKSVSLVGSHISTPISAINPIVSSLLAIALLKEPPNSKIFVGLILAVVGVVLISTVH
ncbi:MAG TPA: DMT family transporter [Thermococcaceae archaeon]|nr:DMT family transporter [Thermococcaceae archaeon]